MGKLQAPRSNLSNLSNFYPVAIHRQPCFNGLRSNRDENQQPLLFMKLQRREFLKQSALSVGGLLVGAGEMASAAESKARAFDPYERVQLGKTKLKFSRVCLGTGAKGSNRQSNQTRLGKEKFEELIK